MNRLLCLCAACGMAGLVHGSPLVYDLAQYQRAEGLEAAVEGESLMVQWQGEHGQWLRASFALENGRPTVRELSVRKTRGEWRALARNLAPEYTVTTGVRRTGHGLPEEKRWDVFWDTPLNRTEEVRRFTASYHVERCEVKTDGARLEISFPGLSMGIFSGKLQFTVYRGANLFRQEAVAKTDEPSVAYKYDGGLTGLSTDWVSRISWRDVKGQPQTVRVDDDTPGKQIVLRARNRVAIAEGLNGSMAVFPPPHQFFFARELEVNLG